MLLSVWDSIKTQSARPFSEGIAHLQKVAHFLVSFYGRLIFCNGFVALR
ncbi:MAG: hypothetical protein LBL62_12300 [Planctomycetaceae bacterium]|nr:hypothetical protein [Planctomycetaceae bacterium]